MEWRVVPPGRWIECGRCGGAIVADEPYAELTRARLVRCRACAGADVDQAAVDRARQAIEARQAAVSTPVEPRPLVRLPARQRRLTPMSEIAGSFFDAKAAAAGRDD